MFYFLYNLASIFLLIPVCLYHLYRSVSRGRPPAFAERFGCIPPEQLSKLGQRPVIWLHAVSVGESIAARPLLKALRMRYPDHAILISNTTETGRGIASTFAEQDLCIYFPFDFLPAVRRTLRAIRPAVVIIMETEIWPNFNREAASAGIPVLLANGRISDRSYGRYLKFSWFFRHALGHFNCLCMQTAVDRERIIAVGAPAGTTRVAGNLKYDVPLAPPSARERDELRQRYNIPRQLTVICAGSTHPGEEEHVLAAYRELLDQQRELLLVLVPRHPERADAVAALLQRCGLEFRRRTALGSEPAPFQPGQVLLVDTVGELMGFYGLSDLVFVGGSLVPTGGHNLLEPASLGVPSVFGPHMANFREIASLTLQYRAGVQIDSSAALAGALGDLIDDCQLRHSLGQNGLTMMTEQGGATGRHMEAIAGYLEGGVKGKEGTG